MAKFYYNGVLLPEIPSDVLAEYPYCLIYIHSSGNGYSLLLGKSNWYINPSTNSDYTNALWCSENSDLQWYRCLLTDGVLSDKWVFNKITVGFWGDPPILWSNHDIYQVVDSVPTLYFEATELIPEVAEDVLWYQIKASTLKGFADEARRIDGEVTTPLTPTQIQEIFENAYGGMSGLPDSHNIKFYDEYQNGLAFYSIKQGHSINAPVYNCKSWQTDEGVGVMFPYKPTEDTIIVANNDTWASKFYGFYNIDPVVYPVFIVKVPDIASNWANIYFANSYSKEYKSTSKDSTARNYLRLINYLTAYVADIDKDSSWEEIYTSFTTNKPSLTSASDTTFDNVYNHSTLYYNNEAPTYYVDPNYYTLVKMEE